MLDYGIDSQTNRELLLVRDKTNLNLHLFENNEQGELYNHVKEIIGKKDVSLV